MLLDRLVSRGWANPTTDFVGFVSPNHTTFSLQSLGLVGKMCSAKAIAKIDQANLLDQNCDVQVTIRQNAKLFEFNLIPLPKELARCDVGFQMEVEADLKRAQCFLEAAGEDLSWERLAQIGQLNSLSNK